MATIKLAVGLLCLLLLIDIDVATSEAFSSPKLNQIPHQVALCLELLDFQGSRLINNCPILGINELYDSSSHKRHSRGQHVCVNVWSIKANSNISRDICINKTT